MYVYITLGLLWLSVNNTKGASRKRAWMRIVKLDMDKLGTSEDLATDTAGRRRVMSKSDP